MSVNSSATTFSRTDAYGDFSIGTQPYNGFSIPGAQPGLVLAQAASVSAPAQEEVTFNFGIPVQSVSFTIYDLTRTTGTAVSSYVDAVSFDKAAVVTATGDAPTGTSDLVKGTDLAGNAVDGGVIAEHQWPEPVCVAWRQLPNLDRQSKRPRATDHGWRDLVHHAVLGPG